MPIDITQIKQCIRQFDFERLFIEELGWDHHKSSLDIIVDDVTFQLSAIAHKRGMVSYLCFCEEDIPAYPLRRKIENKIARSVHEHLIIYTDSRRSCQIWQWIKRELGKPAACREHRYYAHQPGDSLAQKLGEIVISLEEEESLTTVDVVGRVRTAFDVERLTKRFYDRFKKEHATFLKFIEGIPDEHIQRWYASVMLNRLMFIYFIQKKGFLNNDTDYLRNKLGQVKEKGKNRFYKDFLCPLFFEGFAKQESERALKVNKLLGNVPYLNGGIFQQHEIEQSHGKTINLVDKAFEKIFNFFDAYQWHLDERPLRADNEINPDVLGYIFEKYINQKQMGAYYTKEDITGYISRNTVIPRIFDIARQKCKIAFEGEQSVWRLLRENPDRYIFKAVKKGVDLKLPEEISVGLNEISKRTEWNKSAPEEYALPTEVWREVVARRQRYDEVRSKLVNSEISSINDFITYNLDICQFAQDVIENCEGPELLRSIWYAIAGRIPDKSNEKFQPGISILDPACGSGAFLFAALNILESLYEACLDRMQVFLNELDHSDTKHHPEKFGDFCKILTEVDKHTNRSYFVYKSIIINNLFGVDIMEEGIEICKLRLFLKLVAQIEKVENIEPLPDIDFNIRAGNTLVGFTSLDEVKKALKGDLVEQMALPEIDDRAQIVDRAYQRFREMQISYGMDANDFTKAKEDLNNRLVELEHQLNGYLAGAYGIKEGTKKAKEKYLGWLSSHQPFHWFIEFHGIIKNGGFDVIIGNPPYVEYSKVKKEYTIQEYVTESCGNLYAYFLERSFATLNNGCRMGMIIQLPIVCTDRMKPLQKECLRCNKNTWFANFDDRPARLFDGLEHIRASILITQKATTNHCTVYSTNYNRWYSEARPVLFELLRFVEISDQLMEGAIPKIGSILAKSIKERIQSFNQLSDYFSSTSQQLAYFHNSPQYWIRAMDFVPYFWNERDGERVSSQVKSIRLNNQPNAITVVAALNSSLFYWWFLILSDCRHLNMREIEKFPVGLSKMTDKLKKQLESLTSNLMDDFKNHAERKECYYKTTGQVAYDEFFPKKSKHLIDKIDVILAKHYGFTDEELDFIINYDIKYRMGREARGEDE